MDLNKEEMQYILNAIDTHVRANGIKGAGVGVVIVNKLQEASQALATEVPAESSKDSETEID